MSHRKQIKIKIKINGERAVFLFFVCVLLGFKSRALCMLHMCSLLCYIPSLSSKGVVVAGMGWKERCFSAVFNGKVTQNCRKSCTV